MASPNTPQIYLLNPTKTPQFNQISILSEQNHEEKYEEKYGEK